MSTRANAVALVAYDDSGPWPSDDGVASIHLNDLAANGANWALSTAAGATPVGVGRTSTGNGCLGVLAARPLRADHAVSR